MSINGVMRTGVSGMNAQANRLSTVADNIANSNTNGYKRAAVEFSSMILDAGQGEYNSGAVESQIRYSISQQGALTYTSSATDLAVSGTGFFMVQDEAGGTFYTRAGSFVTSTDAGTGTTSLVNAAGYRLTGQNLKTGVDEVINLSQGELTPSPTNAGKLAYNFPVDAVPLDAAVPEMSPGDNDAASVVQFKNSLTVYDNVGVATTLDVYATKTADDTWEIAVFNEADAAPGGGFPYANDGVEATITFDPATGRPAAAVPPLTVNVLNGNAVVLDLSDMTQFAADFTPELSANGGSIGIAESFMIGDGGMLSAVNSDGTIVPMYQLQLARFASADNLKPLAGNVYAGSTTAGVPQIGFPEDDGFGAVVSGALEQSNVDLASELTSMIESQRGYSANSKVFQTGSEILDVLVNLKR